MSPNEKRISSLHVRLGKVDFSVFCHFSWPIVEKRFFKSEKSWGLYKKTKKIVLKVVFKK